MEVASTSHLVSLEIEKTTAAFNFQTMVMNSFVMSHDLRIGQIGSYAYMEISSYLQFHDGRTVKKCPLRNIYKKRKIKTNQQ